MIKSTCVEDYLVTEGDHHIKGYKGITLKLKIMQMSKYILLKEG